ncbi:MAG: hypothetical protein ACYTGG_05325 [Planctomycetota bacterium]|jgi:hypothetical protein
MHCNIDSRGRAVRLVIGGFILVVGIGFVGLRGMGMLGGTWPWWVGAAAIICGTVGIFEARAGWCVVRAMGIRTPL